MRERSTTDEDASDDVALTAAGANACPAQLVASVRALIAKGGAAVSIGEVARVLGISIRTLQRRLAAIDTSFARERATALLLRATKLLATSDDGISQLAAELGYKRPARFVEAFRASTGMPPGQWRRARRAGVVEPIDPSGATGAGLGAGRPNGLKYLA